MALKITVKHNGQDVILEGDTSEVVTAARSLLGDERTRRKQAAPPPPSLGDILTPRVVLNTRAGRGENAKDALRILSSYASHGALQATIRRALEKHKGQKIAVSSVRHAMIQLVAEGSARRDGDIYRITSEGIKALAVMEAAA